MVSGSYRRFPMRSNNETKADNFLYRKNSSRKRRIPRCNGRNPSRSGGNYPEAEENTGKSCSVAGENHPAAGENGSVALQRHFLRLHLLIFRGILPSTRFRRTPYHSFTGQGELSSDCFSSFSKICNNKKIVTPTQIPESATLKAGQWYFPT